MPLILLALLLSQAPPQKLGGGARPKPSEMAHLFFLAGDLARAVDQARQCNVAEKGKCKAMLVALAEYQFLANRIERFSAADARSFIALDRTISKTVPGKLTEPVLARWVKDPIARATQAATAGDRAQAEAIAVQVLQIDPGNADARALAGRDAGR